MSTSTTTTRPHRPPTPAPPPSPFDHQRAALVSEIAVSLEHVLQNINRLNRSLEGVIAVGNEFGAVEALWSQFENVMGKGEGGEDGEGGEEADEGEPDAGRAGERRR